MSKRHEQLLMCLSVAVQLQRRMHTKMFPQCITAPLMCVTLGLKQIIGWYHAAWLLSFSLLKTAHTSAMGPSAGTKNKRLSRQRYVSKSSTGQLMSVLRCDFQQKLSRKTNVVLLCVALGLKPPSLVPYVLCGLSSNLSFPSRKRQACS